MEQLNENYMVFTADKYYYMCLAKENHLKGILMLIVKKKR